MNADVMCSFGLLFSGAAAGAAYVVRVATRGIARFARVDEVGASPLLGRAPMETTQWALTPVARACERLRISANTLTGAALVFAVGAAIAMASGHFGLGAAAMTLSSLCDALDGRVARETATASEAGEVFDATVDRYAEFLFLSGVAIAYRTHVAALMLALAALAGCFMVSYSTAKAEAMHTVPPRGALRRPERAFYLILGAGLVPVSALVPDLGSGWATQIPMLFALTLVGLVGNASAVRRSWLVATAVRGGSLHGRGRA